MKKRILLLVLALALLVGCLAISSMAVDTKTGYCEACKQNVTWEPIVYGTVTNGKHYYFPEDTAEAKQIIATAGVTACVDLNGKQITFAGGRAFLAYEATAAKPACLNIQDSVGSAKVTSYSYKSGEGGYTSSTNNGAGGVMWSAENCTINIYGGTYSLENKTSSRTSSGGIAVLYPNGTMNIYGGTFNGATLGYAGTTYGGCIEMQDGSMLNIYGGKLTSGNATVGKCINMRTENCKITLSGDAWVEDIYALSLNPAALTVKNTFTGSATISYKSDVTVSEGTVIGTLAEGGSLAAESLYCSGGNGFTVVADGTDLKLTEPSAEDKRYECPKCKQTVIWEAFTTTAPSTSGTYHYYLNRNYTTAMSKQYHVQGGAQACVDLNGFGFNTSGRAIYVDANSVLSLMDTKGNGYVCGSSGANNSGGGTLYVASGSTFNLCSGTMKFKKETAKLGVGRGAVIQTSGTVNVYGGKIEGGELVVSSYNFGAINGYGGAIYNGNTVNIYGGEITSGTVPETGAAPCIYMAGSTSKITLSGDAKVEDIYFTNTTASRLKITGVYTGSANLSYDPGVAIEENMQVGTLADGADVNDATITCAGANVLAAGSELRITSYNPGTVAATGGVGYPNLQAAIDAAQEGALVELMKSQGGDITVDKTVCLQLNGCQLTGSVTVAEGKTLYGMDSNTDDYTVADGRYGKIANVTGNVAGVTLDMDVSKHNYLAVNESGSISFHCVSLEIFAMTLRTSDEDDTPGLYYKSNFRADEKAAPLLTSFGIALNLNEMPTAENLEEMCCLSEFTGFESGELGNLGNATSTLLKGILKPGNSEAKNLSNLERTVYGKAYAKTADGQYLFGEGVSRNLLEQLQDVDAVMDGLSAVQTRTATELYFRYKDILQDKGLTNIHNAWENEEKGTLKVLVVGNSHGLDTTNLLAEVFCQERLAGNHDQDVLIAALYYSGCKVSQHKSFMSGNQQEYTYHKNDAATPGKAWTVVDSTALYALQDEQWDVILMQQMNTNAGKESDYKAADWKYVAEYLLNNQDIKPILGFNMTWANPDDYELFLNDDAPYNIRYISTYSDPANWRKNHENLFNTGDGKYQMEVMYAEVMRLTQKYLVDSTDWLGKDYFDERYIMNSATPVQYAQKVLGREQLDIYRDYTHVSDYGRLICAYQWYAQLMGLEELTEVNTDVIPKNLKHKNSKYPTATDANGNYIVDAQMKSDLIESVNWALKNPFTLPEGK